MNILEQSIVKTIAYYEALGEYPLTSLEIYRYLQREEDAPAPPKYHEILSCLRQSDRLKTVIDDCNGFYFLKGHGRFCLQRICRQKISINKWRKIRRIAVFLSLTPFLRSLLVSGSLSINNTKPESDIDFLVVTEKNRIWTSRTFLALLLQIIGQRRHGSLIAGRVCLNQYVARDQLSLEFQNLDNHSLSLSNAHLHSRLIPLTGYQTFQNLQEYNRWAARYIFFFPHAKNNNLRRVSENSALFRLGRRAASLTESAINGLLGDYIEQRLALWQIKRIKLKTASRKPRANELYLSGGLLLFHYPVCKNNEAAGQYANITKQLPLW